MNRPLFAGGSIHAYFGASGKQGAVQTLDEIATLVSSKEVREPLGATRHELKALIDDGALNPTSSIAALRLVWRLPDAIDLLAELKSLAVALEGTVEGWETIPMAKNRSGLKTDQIIAAIRDGHVHLGRQPDRANYSDLLVCKFEMDEFVRQAAPDPGPILISASKFCREIGLLDAQNFYALFAAGHTPAVRMKNPKPGVMQICLTPELRDHQLLCQGAWSAPQ